MTLRTHLFVGGLAFALVLVGMALAFRSASYSYDTKRVGPPPVALEVTLIPDLPQRAGNRLEMRGPREDVRVTCIQGDRQFDAPVERAGPDRHTAYLDFPADGTWTIEIRVAGTLAATYRLTVGTPGLAT